MHYHQDSGRGERGEAPVVFGHIAVDNPAVHVAVAPAGSTLKQQPYGHAEDRAARLRLNLSTQRTVL